METGIMRKESSGKGIRLFYLFLTGCIVGWIYEVTLGFLYGYGFVNRGFLFGPYLPIYGFGLILLNLTLHRLIKKPVRVAGIKINPILVFFGIIVITTVLELIVGYCLLEFFQLRLWDYTKYWMNFMGIISFKTSLRFGIGGMFLLYVLIPLTDKLIAKFSLTTQKTVMIIVSAVMILDLLTKLLGR